MLLHCGSHPVHGKAHKFITLNISNTVKQLSVGLRIPLITYLDHYFECVKNQKQKLRYS